MDMKKHNESILATEGSVEITQSTLLCFNGIYFRIIDVGPIIFSEEKEINVNARFEGFMLLADMKDLRLEGKDFKLEGEDR